MLITFQPCRAHILKVKMLFFTRQAWHSTISVLKYFSFKGDLSRLKYFLSKLKDILTFTGGKGGQENVIIRAGRWRKTLVSINIEKETNGQCFKKQQQLYQLFTCKLFLAYVCLSILKGH